MASSLGGIGSAFSNRSCAIYLTGMFVSLNGSFVFTVALGWLTWELTNSAGMVGTIVFAETMPNAILAPFVGAIIDRGNPLTYQRLSQAAQGLVMVALTVITLTGQVTIELLILFAFLQGIFNAFAVPAHFAMMPKLVERKDISAIMALQSACAQSARFLGPAIAGGFLVTLGAGAAFAFNAVTFFIYVLALAFVRIDHAPAGQGKRRGLLADTAEGFAYSWNQPSIRMLMIIAVCAALLLRPVIDLMPAFVGDVLNQGPAALAWFLSATGGAALVASLWLARRNNAAGLTRYMLGGFLVSGLAIILFAAQSSLAVGVGLMVVFGIANSIVNVSNQILLQVGLDDRIRARVMGIYSLTFRAVPAVGALVVGGIGTLVSLPIPIIAGAGASLVVWFWVLRMVSRHDLEAPPNRGQPESP
jgi:MFS family permease